MLTWYSATWPSASLTRWSLIQAAVTPRRVLVARSSPWRIASSKLCGEVAEISVTRATAMAGVLRDRWRPGPPGPGARSTWPAPRGAAGAQDGRAEPAAQAEPNDDCHAQAEPGMKDNRHQHPRQGEPTSNRQALQRQRDEP